MSIFKSIVFSITLSVIFSLIFLSFSNDDVETDYQRMIDQTVFIDVVSQINSDRDDREDKNPERIEATGSGIIFDSTGNIVTNYHVIEGAKEITVEFSDGVRIPAKIVGIDEGGDIAVIKVMSFRDFTVARWGDSDEVKIGDDAIAVGNPLGVKWTVTRGIISNNKVHEIRSFTLMLQTDASINPGNSGGPLFDLHGNVIGVNDAIVSKNGSSDGLGFSITSNYAKKSAERIISGIKEIRKSMIGASVSDNYFSLSDQAPHYKDHVLVGSVMPNSPADQSGIKEGDIITFVDDVETNSVYDLILYISAMPENSTIKVKLKRPTEDGNYELLETLVSPVYR